MKKLTLKDLQSLAHELPVVSEKEQRVYVGGGTGSNLNPFSEEEYRSMLGDGTWEGGFVMTDESGSTGMSMQYIPSSTSAEEDLLPESAENHDLYSMFDNHQLMTMDLNDGDSENCSTMPSGYWDGSGFGRDQVIWMVRAIGMVPVIGVVLVIGTVRVGQVVIIREHGDIKLILRRKEIGW